MNLDPILTTGVLFAWGLLVKRIPALKALPNNLIPYMNLAIAVVGKLVTAEPANSSCLGCKIVATMGWWLPLAQTTAAYLVYEAFVRPGEKLLKQTA
jgi:hypothetical protein